MKGKIKLIDKILNSFGKTKLSIDIGSQNIKIVEGKYVGGRVQINKIMAVPTPSDAFYNGQIIDKEKLREAIGVILKKEDIKTKNVAFTLESMDAISREITLPWAKSWELEQIIGFEAEQYLPIEIDKYILQYKTISEFEEEGVKKVVILIVALPKVIGENYLDLGKSVGLAPHYLDTHSNAIHKLLSPGTVVNGSYPLEGQTIAVIDLGHRFINITVINKGQFEFNRLLNNGGRDIDTSMTDLFDLSLEEAVAKKTEIKNINYDMGQGTSTTLIGITRRTVLDWLDEIQKIFRYYTSRSTGNVIDSICIYGGSSNIGGISTYIQEFFNIPTLKLNSLDNIKFDNNLEEVGVSSYINAIGAIIRR